MKVSGPNEGEDVDVAQQRSVILRFDGKSDDKSDLTPGEVGPRRQIKALRPPARTRPIPTSRGQDGRAPDYSTEDGTYKDERASDREARRFLWKRREGKENMTNCKRAYIGRWCRMGELTGETPSCTACTENPEIESCDCFERV